MSGEPTLDRIKRVARKPPRYLAKRALDEARREGLELVLAAAARGHGPLTLGRSLPRGADLNARPLVDWNAAIALARTDPATRTAIEARMQRVRDGRAELFGDAPVAVGDPPRWLDDVHSGFGWPLGSARALDYRNEGRASDVKIAWELSRLRDAVTCAQAAAVLDDEHAVDQLDRMLADWRTRNPVGWSVNWACAMEVALRAVNLISADAILVAAGKPLPRRRELVASLYQHGWFLARNLEISDINGNHYLADAAGLVWLGKAFAGAGESDRWLRTGIDMVRSAARDQILADGLDHEGSLPYHLLVLELFLAARAASPELASIDPALQLMSDAARAFCAADGRVPNLGDDDGGRALAFADTPSRDARRVLGLADALLSGAGSGPDALWLRAQSGEPTTIDRSQARHLADGGVLILGDGHEHVVVDIGPIGFRGRGGHGHLDACSYEFWRGDQAIVRDSGTATYTGDPATRNALRDAAAHNVCVIDDRPYARIGGIGALWQIEGDEPPQLLELDGQRARIRQTLPAANGSARFERELAWQPGELVVTDTIAAPQGAEVRCHLQLPPDTRLDDGYAIEAPDHAQLDLQPAPWSERYGSLGEAMRLTIAYRAGAAADRVRVTARRP